MRLKSVTPPARMNPSVRWGLDAVYTATDFEGAIDLSSIGSMINGDVNTGMSTAFASSSWTAEKKPQAVTIARTPLRSSALAAPIISSTSRGGDSPHSASGGGYQVRPSTTWRRTGNS